MNTNAKSQSVASDSSTEPARQVGCPYHTFGASHTQIWVKGSPEEPTLVGCEPFRLFLSSGGCRGDGCPFLGYRTIRQCPFDKNGRADTAAVLANGNLVRSNE